ncbi:hypothetical protein ABPG74_011396 [Tetrahymena malaccensis]
MGCCQSDERDFNIITDYQQNYSIQSLASSSDMASEKISELNKGSTWSSLRYDQILERRQKQGTSHMKYNLGYINVNVCNTPKADFFSQYTMGKFLGQGGFGTVCVGIQKITNVKRAIKMVSKVTLSEKDKKILLQELALLKSIDHPNILKILEHYEDDQHHFFVTELLSGGELFTKIMELNGFNETQASGYMRQILSAVSYCHQQNIVHRDLKPENILFTSKKSDQIKVIDFGCSTRFDKTKKIKDIAGTVLYLAPEVIKKNLYDEKCDIWSLGVVLYIMLCGYPPFDGKNDEEVFNAIQNQQVKFEGKEWEKISVQAKDLIEKMLQKDPDIRLSAQQAYQHPWIQKSIKSSNIQDTVMKNLASFSARNKVKTALLNMISLHILKNKEKEQIFQNFIELDKDGDGQLSKEELIEGYERLIGDKQQAQKIVEYVFKEIDYDGSGKVSFQEFLVATASKEQIITKDNLNKAFDLIDEDRNGFITKDELQRVIGGTSLNDQVWEQMMKECDMNGDGQIDKKEFVDLMFKWVDYDLFKAKDEVIQAEDRQRKASLTNDNLPQKNLKNKSPQHKYIQQSADQRYNFNNSSLNSNLKQNYGQYSANKSNSQKGPNYSLYNNYYSSSQGNFYSSHKSMVKNQIEQSSPLKNYNQKSMQENKVSKNSIQKSIKNFNVETESYYSNFQNNFDSIAQSQEKSNNNSINNFYKVNTYSSNVKTFQPQATVSSGYNSKVN